MPSRDDSSCFSASSLGQPHLDARLGRVADQPPDRVGGLLGVLVREHRDATRLGHASPRPPRPRASDTSDTARAIPGTPDPYEALAVPRRTRQPRGRESEHRHLQRLGHEPADRLERLSPVVCRAHHAALPHPLAAELELGLHKREAVERALGSDRGQHGREHLGERDERDVEPRSGRDGTAGSAE